MLSLSRLRSAIVGIALAASGTAYGNTLTATFDDLPTLPALNDSTGLQFANDNSLVYQGITWDSRVVVVGDQYKVNPDTNAPPNPLFGIPHSPHYFVTNENGANGLTIATDRILTGAWFGRNQYYGFGEGGADQITIVALSGTTVLRSVVFDLPESHPGEPEPLSFVDTSVFATLSGITGYRIDRRELGDQNGNWVADDFQFSTPVPVPLPGALLLLGSALVALSGRISRKEAV
jgi:hypothetical protein